jgi:Sec-independent protein translocase protein TatA
MNGLGKGIRSFKKGLNDIEEEIKSDLNDDKPSSSDEN